MNKQILWRRMLVSGLALALDLWFGDPPNRLHPVAWMGNSLAFGQRHAPRRDWLRQFCYGCLLAGGGALCFCGIGQLSERGLRRLPWWLGVIGEAVLLKMTVALRGLGRAADAVYQPLVIAELPTARQQLHWHLVSRDTSKLTAAQVAAATIESVAENASDSVVAPLFWYAVGGLPAALAYRFLNTADAMIGYRDPAREWLGKASARLDDGMNLLPARLTALLLVAAAWCNGLDAQRTWRVWRRDARLTASPNAGHPMSAMAGALGVELEKVDHYRLGAGQRLPEAVDIQRSVLLLQVAVMLAGPLYMIGAMAYLLLRKRVQRTADEIGGR